MNSDGRGTWARLTIGIGLPFALLTLSLLPAVLFRARLPEPLATHWGISGQPNGYMSFAVLIVFTLAFVGAAGAVLNFAVRRTPARRGAIAPTVAIATWVGATMTIASWQIVVANLDVPTWREASSLGFVQVAAMLFGAALVAALAMALARTLETAPDAPRSTPSAGLAPGSRAVWIGTARSVWALPMIVGLVVVGVLLARTAPPVGLILALVGLAGLPFTSISVTADRRGVRIHYGALGWPRQRVPLADIRCAQAIDVVPMQRGGWGYRGSLRLFGRAYVVLRAGEGIELDLVRDRRLVITVDRAAEGAGVINDLVGATAAS